MDIPSQEEHTFGQTDADGKPTDSRRQYGVIIAGIVVAFAVWFFGFRPFLVNGLSMYPNFNTSFVHPAKQTLISGDYLIIDIFSYLFLRGPERFDVVVARSPTEPGKHLLKRIIGLPGERVNLSGSTVAVTTGEGVTTELDEWYINQEESVTYRDQTITLGEEQYFLLGDNRLHSLDSRVWGGLTREKIIGRVIFRLYPLDMIEMFPGEYK